MLSARTGKILETIVRQYVASAVPVPSVQIARKPELRVSPATIRNEMALLEEEGYTFRPHISAGSVPLDKGYRYYVDTLERVELPQVKQRLISHIFHQAEVEIDKWLSLAATLLAQTAQNVAVVTPPKPADCKFKHMELIALKESLALVVLILQGAKIKQRLISFDQAVYQPTLSAIANKLNAAYSGLDRAQIQAKNIELSLLEKQITTLLLEMMAAESEPASEEEPYLDGWHFLLNQPEFTRHREQVRDLMELVEHRSLIKNIVPSGLRQRTVHVIIGTENKAGAIQNFSVVISHYGIPDEAAGIIGVIGPTRMTYPDTISAIEYLSIILSTLIARLYGREPFATGKPNDIAKES